MVSCVLFERIQRYLDPWNYELLSLFDLGNNKYWGEVRMSTDHTIGHIDAEIMDEKIISMYLTVTEETSE